MAGRLVLELIIANVCPRRYYPTLLKCIVSTGFVEMVHQRLMTIILTWKDSWLIKSSLAMNHLMKLSKPMSLDMMGKIQEAEYNSYRRSLLDFYPYLDEKEIWDAYTGYLTKRHRNYMCCDETQMYIPIELHMFWHELFNRCLKK